MAVADKKLIPFHAVGLASFIAYLLIVSRIIMRLSHSFATRVIAIAIESPRVHSPQLAAFFGNPIPRSLLRGRLLTGDYFSSPDWEGWNIAPRWFEQGYYPIILLKPTKNKRSTGSAMQQIAGLQQSPSRKVIIITGRSFEIPRPRWFG